MCASSWPRARACSTARSVPADHILFLDRLDPEARRKIGQVGDDGDEGAAGIDLGPAFGNLAIEVRDDGDQQVGGLFPPELLQQA